MKIIDISVPITNGMLTWPGDPPVALTKIGDIAKGDDSNISYLPVIDCEDPCKLVGVISQNDVLATYHIPKLGQAE